MKKHSLISSLATVLLVTAAITSTAYVYVRRVYTPPAQTSNNIEVDPIWVSYDADHVVPHSKGGQTLVENAQVLCRYHNQQKGNRS